MVYSADNIIKYDVKSQTRIINIINDSSPIQFMSGTKSIVSILIGNLYALGKIDLNLPITTYIPDYKTNITTMQILTHTSGLDSTWNGGKKQFRAKDICEKLK